VPLINYASVITLRDELNQADRYLTRALLDERNPGKKIRLDLARSAVRDALRWLSDKHTTAAILVALDKLSVGDLSAPAARHIEMARHLCRQTLKLPYDLVISA
jgi:hypothetical protein